jgi:predicted N-acetyltransferase YhbS
MTPSHAAAGARDPRDPVTLPGGLVLRTGRPADLDQVGALLADRGEDDDALDHRLVVEDPDLGWDACAVVVDGDRVVATATLLDESVRLAGAGEQVVLPAGQVELVAVAESHEHRGLARALMTWAHDRSAARGHVVQVMIGIPYFYRLFGYEYAVDMTRARAVERLPETGSGPVGHGATAPSLRAATHADLPALVALQDAAQAAVAVAVPHPPARWRAALGQTAAELLVLERDGAVVASARVRRDDDGALVAEPAAADPAAARDLLRALVAELTPGDPTALAVVHRPGTVTGAAWDAVLAAPDDGAEQYYVRVPDPAALLDAVRGVLAARALAAGVADRLADGLLVSTYGAHVRLPWDGATFGAAVRGGPMQSPGEHGGFGVAPDQLGALVLGAGFEALRLRRPDVYGPRALGPALFPAMTADVLSYYLPW